MKKILFTGPESSGKTSLSTWCIHAYNAQLVPEYARYYLGDKETYDLDDVQHIVHAQMKMETDFSKMNPEMLIVDTSLLVLDIWLWDKFGHSVTDLGYSLDHLKTFTQIFLCKPDIPWEYDPQRENPLDRDRLFSKYRNCLKDLGLNFVILEGERDARVASLREHL
jgi:nicotinamide riboside kinase